VDTDLPDVGPVALKVVRQLRRQVLSGLLNRGTPLPSVRELAETSGVAVATASRALQQAEREGWARRHSGRRLEITEDALERAKQLLRRELPPLVFALHSREVRMEIEVEVTGFTDGFSEVFPDSWVRHLYVDFRTSLDDVKQLLQKGREMACEVGYVLVRMPTAVKRLFDEASIPCVVRGYVEPDINLPCVYQDMVDVGRIAGRILCRTGPVVCLCCHELIGSEAFLVDGVKLAAQELGAPAPVGDTFYHHLPSEMAEYFWAISRLLSGPNRPRSILAIRPEYAMAAVQVASQMGIRVPQDLQIIGLRHSPLYRFASPEIASIGPSSPVEQGRRCAELLAGFMGKRPPVSPRVVIESTLIERGSILPIRSGM
jgi:DNA-binding LacI/PurR family transcriptional regulator